MSTETSPILEAEQAVHDLLTHLERLKREIESYGRAKATLEESGQKVAGLASELGRLAEESRTIVAALGKIGTPEILKQIELLGTANRDLVGAVNRTSNDVRDSQARMEATARKSSETVTEAIQAVGGTLDSLKGAVQAARTEAASQITSIRATVERRLRRLGLITVLGLATASAVIIATILLNGGRSAEGVRQLPLPTPQPTSQPAT